MKKNFIKILCILSFSISLIGCSFIDNKNVANVTVTKAKTSSSISDTVYTANIDSEEEVSIFPSSVGKVQSIKVDVGQEVKKDDVLFVLDNTELTYKFNVAKANYDSASASYDKVVGGSAKQAQVDAAKSLESAENELKDAKEAYDIARSQYDDNTSIASAQVAYDSAKTNYDRTNTLFSSGAVSQADLETAQDKLDTSKAALDIAITNTKMALSTAETRLNNAQASYNSASTNSTITNSITNPENITSAKATLDSAKASLDLAQYSLDNANIKSPIDGKISTKNINVGEYTSSQTPSLAITNDKALNVTIRVTETNIQNIGLGMKADIFIPSCGLSYDGTVATISPSADAKTGMFDVKVNIDTPDDNLNVGMVTNVTLIKDTEDDSLLIPSQCVFKDDDTSYVYIIDGDKLSKKTVEVSNSKDDYLEILSGLSKDDEIVIQGSSNMADNMKCNVVKSD